jgi:hypothetical protein
MWGTVLVSAIVGLSTVAVALGGHLIGARSALNNKKIEVLFARKADAYKAVLAGVSLALSHFVAHFFKGINDFCVVLNYLLVCHVASHTPTWTAGRDFAIENGRNAGG